MLQQDINKDFRSIAGLHFTYSCIGAVARNDLPFFDLEASIWKTTFLLKKNTTNWMICLLSWRAFNTIVIWILGFVGKLGLGTKCTETIGNNGRFQEVEEFNSKNVQTWACCATCTCRLQRMTQAFTNAFCFWVYLYLWIIGFLWFWSWVFLHLCIFVLMYLCV